MESIRNKITLEEQKTIMLNILDAVDQFCRRNSINYYLAYGTLLGAIRHKGYIPWDDDIDIIMHRNDYEYFLNNFITERYKVLSYKIEKKYYMSHAKVIDTRTVLFEKVKKPIELGVFIDIFPIDYLGDDYKKAKKIVDKSKFLRNALLLKNLIITKDTCIRKHGSRIDPILYKTAQLLLTPFSREWIISKQFKFVKKNTYNRKTKWIGSVEANIYGTKEVQLSDDYDETIEILFEGRKFKGPKGYDGILKKLYGDYLKLPPEADRIPSHGGDAYWRENIIREEVND